MRDAEIVTSADPQAAVNRSLASAAASALPCISSDSASLTSDHPLPTSPACTDSELSWQLLYLIERHQ